MSYSAYQWRTINHFLSKRDATPQLSAFPYVRFTVKGDSEREKRERAQENRKNKRASKQPQKNGFIL